MPYLRGLFLAELDLCLDDPRETLIVMQEGLGIDVGKRIGFDPDLVRDDPDTVRAMQLTTLQFEKIKSFEELTTIYLKHSSYSPRGLGKWFDGIQVGMGNKRPIDVLFAGFNETDGFNLDSLAEVSSHASFFLLKEGYDAIGAHWYN